MAVVGPLFLDTSVLLGGVIEIGPAGEAAQQLLTAIADGRLPKPLTAWHCCLELYAVATRLPEELRPSPADAVCLIEHEILDRFDVHQLPAEGRRALLRMAATDRLVGGRVYDAHIAEVARASGARVVVTENRRDFVTLLRHGIGVLTAAELVEEAALA